MKLAGVFRKPEMQQFRRFAGIALCACLAETLIVLFAKKPLPLAGIIAACVPLFVVVLVVLPMVRASKNVSKG